VLVKIDVFFCSVSRPSDRLRWKMGAVCYERWKAEPGVNIRTVYPGQIGCEVADFQRYRRVWADEHASGPIYILTDDDCLPQSKPFVEECVAILGEHSEYAILSLLPTNANIMPWIRTGVRDETGKARFVGDSWTTFGVKPGGHIMVKDMSDVITVPGHEDAQVMEHASVGGVRFCRRSSLHEWPPAEGPGYDRTQADALRAAGYRVGYFKGLKMNHLGEGYSSVWEAHRWEDR
jgi:hypothetical protein